MQNVRKVTALASFLLLALVLLIPMTTSANNLSRRDDERVHERSERVPSQLERASRSKYGCRGVEKVSVVCLPDLIISDYSYDDDCNLTIIVKNVGSATAMLSGIRSLASQNAIINIPYDLVLGVGESDAWTFPADMAVNWTQLTINPDGVPTEANSGNNTIEIEPCANFFPVRLCNAAVDPYLNSYDNGSLKGSACLEVNVDGSTATLSGYGKNKGIQNIVDAPSDTVTKVSCQVTHNGDVVASISGEETGTWKLQVDLDPVTVSYQTGDNYEMVCEHEWHVPSEDFHLISSSPSVMIP
ncbi:MAG: hypothetical protein ACPG8W_12145 [Candidatus Promineifilaceae bacterium]